jgi:beta-phosphoglucomutase-like phosphatase (HAD superfamily)
VRELLTDAQALLLDFDGPVCDVFAGFPAADMARRLYGVLTDHGFDVPESVAAAQDPFDVLKYAATIGLDVAELVNDRFTTWEVEAVESAIPTPGTDDLIRSWVGSGRRVAVVSNNSRAAIVHYLDRHDLAPQVAHLAARRNGDPDELKPRPYLLWNALRHLDVAATDAVFVGDSTTDVEAGRPAHIPVIGYANKPGKSARLHEAGAAAITTTMMLTAALA